jgi:RNA polymerase sigma-70 factor, ECF subfamily
VEDTWLGVLNGRDRFDERSSLKAWIFEIASKIARTRAVGEGRGRPFSSPVPADARSEPSVDPDRFFPADHPRFPGRWARAPLAWQIPDERLLKRQTGTSSAKRSSGSRRHSGSSSPCATPRAGRPTRRLEPSR